MCGLLFCHENKVGAFSYDAVWGALDKQIWRGPDYQKVVEERPGVFMGHVRLSILDLSESANQPMRSDSGRYSIVFNGEIYNHLELRHKLGLECVTDCDTETLINGFEAVGANIFDMLDGMFAVVILDRETGDWWAARDRFGIKPLFRYSVNGAEIISSETVSIRSLVQCPYSHTSLEEWRLFRRPVPGHTYFEGIAEILPGEVLKNGSLHLSLTLEEHDDEGFDEDITFSILEKAVLAHELSDVENVCLLSGGIDSAIISTLSTSARAYTVGLEDNNEFLGARDSAKIAAKNLSEISVNRELLFAAWKKLILLRGEPLSVPNEGLIYLVCKSMGVDEKVVLTGEGADEFFFGYDRIFRAVAESGNSLTMSKIIDMYAYDTDHPRSERFMDYVSKLSEGKSSIEFLEDFFIKFHLPGLLRRMDSASMAASKEARVPFVCRLISKHCYRRDAKQKISNLESKLPLREVASRLGLLGTLNRSKIGFSTSFDPSMSKRDEYRFFRKFNLEVLEWS